MMLTQTSDFAFHGPTACFFCSREPLRGDSFFAVSSILVQRRWARHILLRLAHPKKYRQRFGSMAFAWKAEASRRETRSIIAACRTALMLQDSFGRSWKLIQIFERPSRTW